jgi:hypothetical protein
MMRSTRQYVGAIMVLLALAVMIQMRRDRGWAAYEPQTPVMWLRAGPITQRITLGFDSLVADVYWIRAVVYFGKQRLSNDPQKNYDLLFPLLDFVTSLDPRFAVAYRFGAVFLSEPFPGGPGRPDQAVELLKRGMERTPTKWEYPHDIAFVYYWTYRDYTQAAHWFDVASRVPGAPIWLKSTAATTLAAGGDRESSKQLWRQLFETAEIDWIKQVAELRLVQLDALDAIDQLNQIVWRYQARTGRFPRSWQELVQARVLRFVPTDRTGVEFVLNLENEDVRLSERSTLWPLPQGLGSTAK